MFSDNTTYTDSQKNHIPSYKVNIQLNLHKVFYE